MKKTESPKITSKILYYTDSDVFLADSVDLADISDFVLIFFFFFAIDFKFVGVGRGARGAPRRPERGANRQI